MTAGPGRQGTAVRGLAGTVGAVVLAVVLAGCGGPPADAPSDGSGHDDADVTFATAMVPHHAEAIAMAQLADTRTRSPGVRQLAHEMAAEQMPEIVQLQDLLSAWGRPPAPTADTAGAGQDMGGMAMGGMATDQQMRDLGAASGPAFDRLFLTAMIKHHGLGVTMATTELSQGENGDAQVIAQNISDSQQSQITVMLQMLGSG